MWASNFFLFGLLLTVERVVRTLAEDVEVAPVVPERVLLAIAPQNAMGVVKTVPIVGIIVAHRAVVVTMSVRVNAMMFVPVHVDLIVMINVMGVPINVVTARVIASTVVLVPPTQEWTL